LSAKVQFQDDKLYVHTQRRGRTDATMFTRDSPGSMMSIEQGCFEVCVLHSRPTAAACWAWYRYVTAAVPSRPVTGATRENRTFHEEFGFACQTPSQAGSRTVVAYRGYPVRANYTATRRTGTVPTAANLLGVRSAL